MEPLIHLNYPLDMKSVQVYADYHKQFGEQYFDPRYQQTISDWVQYRVQDDYFNELMNDFGVLGKARFYWLSPNANLPEHTDNNTTCSLNFIIGSDSPAPVTIEGKQYSYSQCLLNTTLLHGVDNGPEERVLLKISIFGTPYEEVVKMIPEEYKL